MKSKHPGKAQGLLLAPRFSPDGRSISITVRGDGPGGDIWVYEIARGIFTPFTFDNTSSQAVWTLDGQRLSFHTHRIVQDIFWKPWDGGGEAELLTTGEYTQTPNSWSPEGVLAYSYGAVGSRDIWVISSDGSGKPEPYLDTPFDERDAMFSPDGNWIALTSNQSGQDEVYVKPYTTQEQMVQISVGGGSEPKWMPDGKELFYRNGNEWMAVSLVMEPTLTAKTPQVLFTKSFKVSSGSDFDISPDGQHLVAIQDEPGSESFHVVLNWFEELKRLVPTDN